MARNHYGSTKHTEDTEFFSTEDTDIFLVAYGKKSLGEIFFKEWPEARNNSIQLASKNIIFN